MQPGPQDHRIKVRHKPFLPSVVVVCGLLVIVGGTVLVFGLSNPASIGFLFSGALFVALGGLQLAKPYCVYDPSTGELRMVDVFGFKDRVYGAPTGERLYFNGRNIIRALPNGAQVPVKTWPGNRTDLAHVIALLPQYRTG
jgi:hypothetical protein